MVDCVVRFERRQEGAVCTQSVQLTKYRGSGYAGAEFPVSFGPSGIEVGGTEPAELAHEASSEKVSAGFERLDMMLGGGVFRGSSTLLTGVPGTSETTLAGKFAEAAEEKTRAQIKSLQVDLERQRAELALHSGADEVRKAFSNARESELRRLRGADPPQPGAKRRGNGAAQ